MSPRSLRFVTGVLLVLLTPAGFAAVPYPGNDADSGVTRYTGLADAYTGNLAFGTRDLAVAGAVGAHGLAWQRFTTSRTGQTENLFGLGHNWTHNWQWEMTDAGKDSQGRAVVSVREPQGWVHRFTETASGQWWPAPSVKDRVVSSGDSFTVLRLDAGEVRFTRSATAQGQAFTLREIADGEGRVWKLSWTEGRLVQVTEPAGRWLKVAYTTLTVPGATATSANRWTVIDRVTASDGQTVRYGYQFPAGADYPRLRRPAIPTARRRATPMRHHGPARACS